MNKRQDKRQRSDKCRVFLLFIITFSCCAIIFGAAVSAMLYYMIPSLKASAKASAAYSSSISYPASNSFTMLIGVYSEKDGSPAELLLYRLDTVKNKTIIMPVSTGLAVNFQGASCPVSDVYKSGGISGVSTAIQGLLSIKINFTCNISSGNYLKIFDKLGGLYGSIPESLAFTLPDGSTVNLNASSKQYLAGNKIYALIAYPSYSEESIRLKEQSNLMKEFVTEKLSGYYINNPSTYYGDVFNLVSTDFSMNELLKKIDAIKGLSSSDYILTPQPALTPGGDGTFSLNNLEEIKDDFS
jgi:anionic cell wall polymer biosynthesis LytR-Cps2A-Psr (LCP) family protein